MSTDAGVGWNLSSNKAVQAGVRLWPQFGRSRKDGPAGLDPVGLRIQPQAFANLQVGGVLLLQSGVLYGTGRDRVTACRSTWAPPAASTSVPV